MKNILFDLKRSIKVCEHKLSMQKYLQEALLLEILADLFLSKWDKRQMHFITDEIFYYKNYWL